MTDYGPGPCEVCGEDLEAHTKSEREACRSAHQTAPAPEYTILSIVKKVAESGQPFTLYLDEEMLELVLSALVEYSPVEEPYSQACRFLLEGIANSVGVEWK